MIKIIMPNSQYIYPMSRFYDYKIYAMTKLIISNRSEVKSNNTKMSDIDIDIESKFKSLVLGLSPQDPHTVTKSMIINGDLKGVEWLIINGQGLFGVNSSAVAAYNGHLDIIKLMHQHKLSFTSRAMDKAAEGGHLDIVKWLHENREEGCTFKAMNAAAADGRIDLVKWLHENREEGCTHDALTLAAVAGHLEVVKWLYENRNECVIGLTLSTINAGSPSRRKILAPVIRYLNSVGPAGPRRTEPVKCDIASPRSELTPTERLTALQWQLKTHGKIPTRELIDAMERGDSDTIEYLTKELALALK
jgi:hypothetical protein